MITVTEFAVHPENESPVFGANTVKIKLDDVGGGTFISIEDTDEFNNNIVKLDFTQLNEIIKQIKLLGWK